MEKYKLIFWGFLILLTETGCCISTTLRLGCLQTLIVHDLDGLTKYLEIQQVRVNNV